MPQSKHCLECGTVLPERVPGGLCSVCALRGALASGGDQTPTTPAQEPSDQAPGPPSVGVGRSFGDYELLEEIARGGMGVVYKARQKSLHRIVAVKMLLGGLSSPEYVRRFRTEASAAASLQHPHIVAIHEVGVCQDQQYLVMDYVEGQSLARRISDSRFRVWDFRQQARWMQAIAEAVHYAHEHGILHRDLKPSNVLMDGLDQPRVTDFGLAKRFEEESQLTLSGQILGSPSYMPPEQAEAGRGKVSRRSDVYGLGATFYHVLTGRAPFQGETPTDVLHQVLTREPIAPRLLNPGIPRDLETICLKCLEKEPARRYASAQMVAEELGRFLEDRPILARPANAGEKLWRWGRRKPLAAGLTATLVTVFLLGVGGVLWQWQRARGHAEREAQQRLRAEGETRRAEASERLARQRAYASDMKAAQVALQQSNRGMAVDLLSRYVPDPTQEDIRGIEWRYLWQESRGDELQTLSHGAMVEIATLSPDGRHLATKGRDRTIRLWDVSSGRPIREFAAVAIDQPRKALAYSPDGKWLLTLSSGSHRRNRITGDEGWIQIRETPSGNLVRELKFAESSFCFSPDGKRLATMAAGGLTVWEIDNWKARVLTNRFVCHKNLAFTPNGTQVAFSAAYPASEVMSPIQLWDLGTGATEVIEGEPRSVTLAISPDGKWLASGNWRGEVCLWDLPGRKLLARFRAHPGVVFGLAFSPDGRLLATGGTDQLIHLWEAGTTNRLRTLRGHLNEIWSLEFSADGRRLVSGSKDGTARLWSVEPDPPRSRAFAVPTNSVPAGLLPDGTALVTVDSKARTCQLWNLPDGRLIPDLLT